MISAYIDQFGTVYFDINIYDSGDTLIYTAPRINWPFNRGQHRGVTGNININAVDIESISVTNSYSPFNL